jgi:diguanylate cyclase
MHSSTDQAAGSPAPGATERRDGAATERSGRSSLASTLLLLLHGMEILPDLRMTLAGIKAGLERSRTEQELGEYAGQIAVLINRQSRMLQEEHSKLMGLLNQMTARLDQLGQHLHNEASQREAADQDGARLNDRVQSEVREIGVEVQQAHSLAEVRDHVSRRIAHIGEQLDHFRQRERTRMQQYKQRTELLRSRVDELELQTRELQDSVQREQARSTTDALTGVPNRLALERRMQDEQARLEAQPGRLCVAIWDIDRFKNINDRYGHAAGDKVLRVFAQHLARHMRKTDFAARYGGEEFVTLLTDVSTVEALRSLDRVRNSLRELGFHFDGQNVCVTASCGVSTFAQGEPLESVLKRADRALYQAKADGRDRCYVG